MQHRGRGGRQTRERGEGDDYERRPERGDLALVMLPETGRQQRENGDREQDADEGQRPLETEATTIQLGRDGGVRACQQGGGEGERNGAKGQRRPPTRSVTHGRLRILIVYETGSHA